MNKPFVLGITGGIGSGKSYVCRMLSDIDIPIFYTDIQAKLEMRENIELQQELRALIGPEAVADQDEEIPKAVLSHFIHKKEGNNLLINQIVHPRVKQRTRRWIEMWSFMPILAIESALLFESGFDDLCQKTICVIAPHDLRISRIMQRDAVSEEDAQRWINLQMSDEERLSRSDFSILNDQKSSLATQIKEIFTELGLTADFEFLPPQ